MPITDWCLNLFYNSPAARRTSTWVTLWRRSSRSEMLPWIMNWPGSTAIKPTPLSVRLKPLRRSVVCVCVCAHPSLTSASCRLPGYKLAFNYLKAKRHVDAIDVCHKVSMQFEFLKEMLYTEQQADSRSKITFIFSIEKLFFLQIMFKLF